jgi:hypothetical protein
MYLLRSLSLCASAAVSAPTASSESERKSSELELRSNKLLQAYEKLENAEILLREARSDISESSCHGLLYRIDKVLNKLVPLREGLVDKRARIQARKEVENGD